jgi:hypothetical protein
MGSIFKQAFLKTLGKGMSGDCNKGNFKQPIITTPRHRGKGWTGANRMSQNIVAKSHIVDPNAVRELEALKRQDSGMYPISSPVSLKKIVALYNLQNLDVQHPKTLGNTGIVVFFNPRLNNYCIKK